MYKHNHLILSLNRFSQLLPKKRRLPYDLRLFFTGTIAKWEQEIAGLKVKFCLVLVLFTRWLTLLALSSNLRA
ncbi:hypothetical protein L1987_13378 [Smallanthus sonchifolius]|uniref:Uncharacterized protein n=1 Tax=Smallanthus sonchifolius TaxID=185202 RepID=A0ACB9JJV0_9ASTR|nr:hypothetical protein L1987_13378 [Smallanthus sonchifolius]